MFLMAQSRNGVAAKEIQRQVGVTYKTAWRMNHQIRKLMAGGGSLLTGVVEADETYIGGVRPGKRGRGAAGKTAVVGVVERFGSVRAKVVENVNTATAMTHLRKVTAPEITVVTDESNVYNLTEKFGFRHLAINHGAGEYVRGDVHTNTIEGFWSQVKRSVDGTYHSVSRKFLQRYVDEFAFRYNHRKSAQPMFSLLVERAGEQLSEAG
jgi:transposase-like protein